ncbi:hypothetical protein [Methylomonas koyamae]|uniref:hypothetical protein n=1 Tax=Methylomonas koyamae TaxID=702114 RepID=UPI0028733E57|nr:hypothetical protein [Methylomonas koyamae]WNB77401.1 hypothetical protein RI210_07425 [Methylomonas koyamae]
MMELIRKICAFWTKQNEIPKLLFVGLIIGGATFLFTPKSVKLVTLNQYQNPVNGETIKPTPCTLEPGESQCRIYKDEFVTEEVYTSTVSRKVGSTTCCLTTSSGTIGGEARPATQSCWTVPQDLPRCPTGYQKI